LNSIKNRGRRGLEPNKAKGKGRLDDPPLCGVERKRRTASGSADYIILGYYEVDNSGVRSLVH